MGPANSLRWLALLMPLWAAAACAPQGSTALEIRGATMGTTYSVKLGTTAERVDSTQLKAAFDAELAQVNAHMSTYDPQSELSRFNASNSTEWIDISAATHDVVAEALRISRITGGAFDVTVGPAVNLWGFGPDTGAQRMPDAAEVAATRRRIGHALLMLRGSPPALRKARTDVYVDLSAIAKGYAVDRLADLLDARGIANYLIEVGGELRARGVSARGDAWRIAVEKPLANQRSVQRVLPVRDTGLATSGSYRNFFDSEGQRYSHTIDPRTAQPVDNALASVTVLHPSAMTADALATAMTVLGTQAGQALAERYDIAALFIEAQGDELVELRSTAFIAKVPES